MNFILPILAVLSAGMFLYFSVRECAEPVLVAVLGASTCLILVAFMIVHRGTVTGQRGDSVGKSNNGAVSEALIKEDRKFLDDLFQEQNQEKQGQTSPVVTPGQSLAKGQSDSIPVPRAELIVNTAEVKRAQLVVNGRIVERAELVRP